MNVILTIATALGSLSCGGVETGKLIGMIGGNDTEGIYEINMDTGEATLLLEFLFNPSEGALAVGPDGTLYAAFSGEFDELAVIDLATGDVTIVGLFWFDDVSGLAFAPDGTLYGHDDTTCELITIDVETGFGIGVGDLGFFGGGGFSFGPDGTLFALGNGFEHLGLSSLWTVDLVTGLATEVGPLGEDLPPGDIDAVGSLSFVGDTLYASARLDTTNGEWLRFLFTIDVETGEATKVGPFVDFNVGMAGMVFLPGTGDADRDGDVDLDDFAIFEGCFTGPLDTEDPLPVECQFLDTDHDNDIDCNDWNDFINAWTAPEEPPTFPPCDACPGDVNGDGVVDPMDTGFVLARFGCSVGAGDPDCDAADANTDGVVNPLDTGFILARFGECL